MDVKSNPASAVNGRRGELSFFCGIMMLTMEVVLLISATVTSSAQEPACLSFSRLQDSIRVSSLSFDRVLNTYTWNGSIFFDRRVNGVDVKFRQLLRSRLIRTDVPSIQDEYDDSLLVAMDVGEQWKARAQQVSSVVSDNRAIDLTKLGQHQFLAGARFTPTSRVSLGAMGGYEIDAQQDELDRGFSYQADAEADGIRLEEFRGSFRGQWSQSLLTRRRPEAASADVSLLRDFGPDGNNQILFT